MSSTTTSQHLSSTADQTDVILGEPAPQAAVLIVDDEQGVRNFLKKSLDKHCGLVEVAESAETAEALHQRYMFDLLIVDIRLPGQSGIEWVRRLRERDFRAEVIVMTAFADLAAAIEALRAGAADFILKPFRLEEMLSAVRRCMERRKMSRENFLLRRELSSVGLKGIVGSSPQVKEMCRVVKRIAPTATTVLIEGETGTGKELVARAIHGLSGRQGPFVPLNCGSISPELLESELFGHTRGAFTSAHSSREGLFSYAHRGTLFLDEIGEMPRPMQSKLLRVLEEKVIRPVGADRATPVDARVITATNRRLADEVRIGNFREDLFFRLNVLTIRVPSLRERLEDIPALVDHWSGALARELGVGPLPFTYEDLVRLQSYDWPGNVRELKNVIERSLLLGQLPYDCIQQQDTGDAGDDTRISPVDYPLDWTLAEVEKQHMLRTLQFAAGNKSEAARRLGISRKTMERKLKAWNTGIAAEPRP